MSLPGERSMTWPEELAGFVGESGFEYSAIGGEAEGNAAALKGRAAGGEYYRHGDGIAPEESLKDQLKGFLKASGEMLRDFGRGCSDILQQSLTGMEDSFVVKRLRRPWAVVSRRLGFLNDYLPEDRDPVHSWLVIICVLLAALPGTTNRGASFCAD